MQKQYFLLFSAQGNLMTDSTTVSELTCTYSTFKEKNLCQLCKVARTTQGNLPIFLLEEKHFSCCCINYIILYLSQFRRKVTIKLWHFSGELPFYLETAWSWGHIIRMKWRPLPHCATSYTLDKEIFPSVLNLRINVTFALEVIEVLATKVWF